MREEYDSMTDEPKEEIGLRVVVLGPREGTPVRANLINEDMIHLKVTGQDSNGLLTVLEYHAVPHSDGVEPHTHAGHEEGFYVVDGELSMLVGKERSVLKPGGWGFVPRNVLHAFWNDSDQPCTFVATFTPPGFERIFFDTQRIGSRPFTPEEMAEMARKHGVMRVPWDQVDTFVTPTDR